MIFIQYTSVALAKKFQELFSLLLPNVVNAAADFFVEKQFLVIFKL